MNTVGDCVQWISVPFGDGDVGWGGGVGTILLRGCFRSGNDQENKFLTVRGKAWNFVLSREKLT